jgi:hypothetical protein
MDADVEDLLRSGLERFTAHVQVPGGLVRRVARACPPPPLLGRAGRALTLLFPADSPRSRSVPVWAVVPGYAAAIAGGALVLLLRQSGRPPWDTLWAEDGTLFLPTALRDPWGGLAHQYAGYIQLVPRLIADVVGALPLRAAAAGFAVTGALSASFCAAITFRACAGHVRTPALRAVLGASVVLLPTALIEIANSGIDVPWYLLFAVFWALLWRPRSAAGKALAALIGLAAMSSQILTALYAPLAAARVIALPRAREQAVTFGLLAGGALQAPVILMSHGPHLSHARRALMFYFERVVLSAVAGRRLTVALVLGVGLPGAVVIAACVVILVGGWGVIRGGPRVRAFIPAAMAFSLVLTLFPAMVRPRVTLVDHGVAALWVPGDRYTAAPILLIYSVAMVAADASLRRNAAGPAASPSAAVHPATYPRPARRRHLAVWVLLLALGTAWAADVRYADSRSGYPSWSQAVSQAQGRCQARAEATVWVPQIRAFLPCR